MPLDDQDLRYLDAKFDGLRESTALLISPIRTDLDEVRLSVYGDGNGRKGLIRNLDGVRTEIGNLAASLLKHGHTGMVQLDRKTITSLVSIAAGIAGIVAAAVSIWPRGGITP